MATLSFHPVAGVSGPPGGIRDALCLWGDTDLAGRRAAGLFLVNLRTWKHRAFVRDNYSEETIDQLQEALSALASQGNPEPEMERGRRQIVFERI